MQTKQVVQQTAPASQNGAQTKITRYRKPGGDETAYSITRIRKGRKFSGILERVGFIYQTGLTLQAVEQVELVLFAEGYTKVS